MRTIYKQVDIATDVICRENMTFHWTNPVTKELQQETKAKAWFIRVGHISMYVGDEEPDVKPGDLVKLSLEKVTANV